MTGSADPAGRARTLDAVHPLTQRLIARSPAGLRAPVALTARTVDDAIANRLPGLAAEIAFWILLSAPALVLTVLAALTLVAGDDAVLQDQAIDRIVEITSVALTPEAIASVVRPVLESLADTTTVSVVSFGFAVSVWVASRAVKVILVTVALTYGAQQPGGVGHRVLGLVLTLIGLVIGTVLAPLVIAGPGLGEQLATRMSETNGAADVVANVWRVAYWPVAAGVGTVAIAAVYHLGAPWNTRWRRDLPGAVLATAVWLTGSAGLRLYGTWILGTGSIYGPLAGPIVALLWVWLTAFAVLLGAQLNASVERTWPTRHPRDDAPSGLKKLTTSRIPPVEPPRG